MAKIHGRVAIRLSKLTRLYTASAIILIALSFLLPLVVWNLPLEELTVRLSLTALSVALAFLAGFCVKRAVGYRKGVKGEMEVFKRLRSLPRSYHVFPDVDLIRGDVDFVVVGPTGVFAIEVKHWKGGCLIPRKGGSWKRVFSKHNSRLIKSPVIQVKNYADKLYSLLGVPVEPIVVIAGDIKIREQTWEGVPILRPRKVYEYILSREKYLDERNIHRVVRLLKFFKQLAE